MSTTILPPVVRSVVSPGGPLNKALFYKKLDISAASVLHNSNIFKYRNELLKTQELLRFPRMSPVVAHPDAVLAAQGRKCLLLRPEVNINAPDTWSAVLREGVQREELLLRPYEFELTYDSWSFNEIMKSVLPEEFQDDIPGGFNTAGHVAHLNLRSHHLPYKHLIAQVILDKNAGIRTVINKIDNVGTESEFRTFEHELLAGDPDLHVELIEYGCTFSFNYSKVYWNSKLETEHRRLVELFKPGEVVCDVMAGIGPFAVPAGKKGVFVWANDLNPESFKSLEWAVRKNKVSNFVRAFNTDGRAFIKAAAGAVLAASYLGEGASQSRRRLARSTPHQNGKKQRSRSPRRTSRCESEPLHVPIPPTIDHFVMNLPATAMTFLPHFYGIYAGQDALFAGPGARKLPKVHVYCFSFKTDDDTPFTDICERIEAELGMPFKVGNPETEGQVAIRDVRDTAPSKRMYCATFRIPRAVAFSDRL